MEFIGDVGVGGFCWKAEGRANYYLLLVLWSLLEIGGVIVI